jgi:nicotinamidase-related amidase
MSATYDDPRVRAIAEILAQPRPGVQTQQALIILGMQNDFISPDAKLPVSTESGFVKRITEIVPMFRELVGDVIWVRSEFDAESSARDASQTSEVILDDAVEQPGDEPAESVINESSSKEELTSTTPTSTPRSKSSKSKRKKAMKMFKDMGKQKQKQPTALEVAPVVHEDFVREEEELFLATSKRGPCCVPGTTGADFAQDIQSSIDPADKLVIKSHYSAFNGTSLLVALRMKLITELYICGCMTNVSVYATTLDAARHGFKINIIEDCLGYRTTSRHDTAISTMVDHMGVQVINSTTILEDLNAPPEEGPKQKDEDANALGKMLGGLKLEDARQTLPSPPSDASIALLTASLDAISVSSGTSKTDSRSKNYVLAVDPSTQDDEEALETPTKTIRSAKSRPDINKQYVKTRIRVRSKDKVLDTISMSSTSNQKALNPDMGIVTEVSYHHLSSHRVPPHYCSVQHKPTCLLIIV